MWTKTNPWWASFVISLWLSINGCSTMRMPSLIDELQNQAQVKNLDVPTQLTDLGILRYGEKILASWGMRSGGADTLNVAGQVALAGLSTGVLAASGGGVSPDITRGLAGGFNFVLQALGIVKPAERNDARHEGASMILRSRGAFLKALAAKKIYHISNTRYTYQGSLYFEQIGAAIEVVDKLIVGLAPRIEDLKRLEPVPIDQQPDPGPEINK